MSFNFILWFAVGTASYLALLGGFVLVKFILNKRYLKKKRLEVEDKSHE